MPHTPNSTPPHSHLPTHEVQNQPVPRGARDLWAQDPILQSYAAHAGADLGHLRGKGQLPAAWVAHNRPLPSWPALSVNLLEWHAPLSSQTWSCRLMPCASDAHPIAVHANPAW